MSDSFRFGDSYRISEICELVFFKLLYFYYDYIFDTWAGRCPFLDHIFSVEQENQPLFTRSLLSVLEKVYEGAERMVVRMWTQKLVNPVINVAEVAPR